MYNVYIRTYIRTYVDQYTAYNYVCACTHVQCVRTYVDQYTAYNYVCACTHVQCVRTYVDQYTAYNYVCACTYVQCVRMHIMYITYVGVFLTVLTIVLAAAASFSFSRADTCWFKDVMLLSCSCIHMYM